MCLPFKLCTTGALGRSCLAAGAASTDSASAMPDSESLAHFAATQPLAALQQPLPVYGHALGMAVFSTVLPVLMTSAAIRHIGAGRTALVGSLGPVMTIFFSAWLLGEALSWWQLGGAALVLSGVLLIGISRQRTTSRPAAAAQPAKPPHLAAHR